jgi:hypothetical protein
MKVWVVWTEFNRGADLDGGSEIVGLFQQQEDAERVAQGTRRGHVLDGLTVYGQNDYDDAEWDTHVHVEEWQVQG